MIYKFEDLKVGDSYSLSTIISRDMVLDFAKISGDNNPIHIDEEYAAGTPFKKTIAHGYLVGSLFSRILGCEFPGNGTIYLKQSMKFLAPVYIEDTIIGKVEVIELNEAKKWVTLKTSITNGNGKEVIVGEALVIPPR